MRSPRQGHDGDWGCPRRSRNWTRSPGPPPSAPAPPASLCGPVSALPDAFPGAARWQWSPPRHSEPDQQILKRPRPVDSLVSLVPTPSATVPHHASIAPFLVAFHGNEAHTGPGEPASHHPGDSRAKSADAEHPGAPKPPVQPHGPCWPYAARRTRASRPETGATVRSGKFLLFRTGAGCLPRPWEHPKLVSAFVGAEPRLADYVGCVSAVSPDRRRPHPRRLYCPNYS